MENASQSNESVSLLHIRTWLEGTKREIWMTKPSEAREGKHFITTLIY